MMVNNKMKIKTKSYTNEEVKTLSLENNLAK